jgi:hypothetical protein
VAPVARRDILYGLRLGILHLKDEDLPAGAEGILGNKERVFGASLSRRVSGGRMRSEMKPAFRRVQSLRHIWQRLGGPPEADSFLAASGWAAARLWCWMPHQRTFRLVARPIDGTPVAIEATSGPPIDEVVRPAVAASLRGTLMAAIILEAPISRRRHDHLGDSLISWPGLILPLRDETGGVTYGFEASAALAGRDETGWLRQPAIEQGGIGFAKEADLYVI